MRPFPLLTSGQGVSVFPPPPFATRHPPGFVDRSGRSILKFPLLFSFEPLFLAALDFFDALDRGQVFRHGAAEFTDGLPDFPANVMVNPAGGFLGADVFPAEFFLGLGGTEQVGGQFGAAHVVKDVFFGLEALAPVDVAPAQSTVEAAIAVIHENGIFHRLDDARLFGHTGQLFVMFCHFLPEQEALLVFLEGFIFSQLLPPRLDGKIGLPQCHQRLGRVGILDDEVAGITGQGPIFNLALGARTDADHFGDVNEMVRDGAAAIGTSFAGLGDNGDKVAKVGVFQHPRQFAGGPELAAVFIDALDALERV